MAQANITMSLKSTNRRQGSLAEVPHLYPFLRTQQDKDTVRFMCGSRSATCIKSYDRVFKRLNEFLLTHDTTLQSLTMELLCEYLIHLEEQGTSYGYAQSVHGGINFLVEAMAWSDIWTARVPRCYESLMRACAERRPETKKAEPVPPGAIHDAIEKEILPHLDDIDQIPIPTLRATLFQALQFSLFGRGEEIRELRAADISRVQLAGTDAFKIRFRSGKTDKRHDGNYSHISWSEEPTSLYKLIELYYSRLGLIFGGNGYEDQSYLLPRTLNVGSGNERKLSIDRRNKISMSTLLKDVNNLYHRLGYTCKITGKSAKSSGVSAGFRKGLTDDMMRVRGRWGSINTPQYYRRASEFELLNVAQSLTLSDSGPAHPKMIGTTETASSTRTGSCGTSSHTTSLSSRELVLHQESVESVPLRPLSRSITFSAQPLSPVDPVTPVRRLLTPLEPLTASVNAPPYVVISPRPNLSQMNRSPMTVPHSQLPVSGTRFSVGPTSPTILVARPMRMQLPMRMQSPMRMQLPVRMNPATPDLSPIMSLNNLSISTSTPMTLSMLATRALTRPHQQPNQGNRPEARVESIMETVIVYDD